MFLALLIVTLLTALAISFAVARLFAKPLDRILTRIIAEDISSAWSRYMQFAILVIGVSSGVRIRDLDRYIGTRSDKDAKLLEFGFDRWILELYRTAIDTLQGITWMLLLFFVFAMVAYVIMRIAETRFGPATQWPVQKPKTPDSADPA
jgi:hypothetical protein